MSVANDYNTRGCKLTKKRSRFGIIKTLFAVLWRANSDNKRTTIFDILSNDRVTNSEVRTVGEHNQVLMALSCLK